MFAYIAISTFLSGDMTIGELYTGFQVMNQFDDEVRPSLIFVGIEIAYKSVCIVTKDQPPLDTTASSPTCFYEFELAYCVLDEKRNEYLCRDGRFTAHGSGPRNLQITGGSDNFFGAFGQVREI